MSPRQGWGSLSIKGWQQGDIHCSDNVENVMIKKTQYVNRERWLGGSCLAMTIRMVVAFLVQKMSTVVLRHFLPIAELLIVFWRCSLPNQLTNHRNRLSDEGFLRKHRPGPGRSQGCSGDARVENYRLPLEESNLCWAGIGALQRDTALHLEWLCRDCKIKPWTVQRVELMSFKNNQGM